VLGIVARPNLGFWRREGADDVAVRFQRGQGHRLGQIAESVAAGFASGVFEIHDLAATLAFEQLHAHIPSRSSVERRTCIRFGFFA
jgi:hypothetical protein